MFESIKRAMHNWRAYARTRKELSDLSDDRLRDIGVIRGEIPRLAREIISRAQHSAGGRSALNG